MLRFSLQSGLRQSQRTIISTPSRRFGYSVILPEEPFVYGVSHIQRRGVPQHIARPEYAGGSPTVTEDVNGKVQLGGDAERRLRAAAKLAKNAREFAGTLVKASVTTNEIDAAVHEYFVSRNAYPSPLLYSGFPRSCCTSVNNVLAHGIPDDRPLEDGDIVCVDVTVYLDGYHGDTAQTFLVGNVDDAGKELARMTNVALDAGISACGPGKHFSEIGRAIHEVIRRTDFCVSPHFTGHGIGTTFHRKPWILHDGESPIFPTCNFPRDGSYTVNHEPEIMQPGHCFTIEPCIIEAKTPSCWIFPDGWTASTEDCARAAQAEHMVLITNSGYDVLTL